MKSNYYIPNGYGKDKKIIYFASNLLLIRYATNIGGNNNHCEYHQESKDIQDYCQTVSKQKKLVCA